MAKRYSEADARGASSDSMISIDGRPKLAKDPPKPWYKDSIGGHPGERRCRRCRCIGDRRVGKV